MAGLKRSVPSDPISIRRGDDYELIWRTEPVHVDFQPVDADDWLIAAQVRATADAASVLLDLEPTLATDADDPTILVATIRLFSADTDSYAFTSAVYDIEITDPDGNVVTVVEGAFTVVPDITR